MGENSALSIVGRRLNRAFFERGAAEVGEELLGKLLIYRDTQGLIGGRIVETEAYLGSDDPASHSHRGKTPRNSSMFEAGGTSYVYLIYGIHHCFNVVTSRPGVGEAVLIRALEPLFGIEHMIRRRNTGNLRELCRGPGRLAQAIGLDRQLDGVSLLRGPLSLHIEKGKSEPIALVRSSRIGISMGKDLDLRFCIKGNRFVSR